MSNTKTGRKCAHGINEVPRTARWIGREVSCMQLKHTRVCLASLTLNVLSGLSGWCVRCQRKTFLPK